MEYIVTNPLSIQLLKLFKELSENGVVNVFCAAEPTKKIDIPKATKWIGFTKIDNIDEEDKNRIKFLCDVLEPGLWEQITPDTYIPLEDADTDKYPEGSAQLSSVISCFINGEVTIRNVSGYCYEDVLYLSSEDFA